MKNTGIFIGVLLLAGMASACMTTPVPTGPDDSLFLLLYNPAPDPGAVPVILSLTGPMNLRIVLVATERDLALARLVPGQYEVSTTGLQQEIRQTISIQPGCIFLFPLFLRFDDAGRTVSPVTGTEQEMAARMLLDHIGIQNWFDRKYIGFGQARPKMHLSGGRYTLSLKTDPPGARVFIDKTARGETPCEVELAAGKYTVEVEKPGYVSVKKYVTLDGPLEEKYTLQKTTLSAVANPRQKFQIMVYPFINLDDPAFNPYGTVFQGSIKALFSVNPRYQVREYTGKTDAIPSAGYPDFGIADKSGADLVIAGKYQEQGNVILVHAMLFDVKSQRIKLADIYTGSAGFDVFSSIDKISQDFTRAADTILPEPGQPVVEKEADPQSTLISYEMELFKEHVLEDYTANPHIIGVALALGGLYDPVQEFAGNNARSMPIFIINAINPWYEFVLSQDISFYTSLTFSLEKPSFSDMEDVTWSIFINTGPKLSFRSEKSDISVSTLLTAGFAPPLTVTKDMTTVTVGPFVFFGGRMGIGYRYYLQNRLSERPVFLDFSMNMDLAVFRFNFQGYSPLFVPLHIILTIGGGYAL